MLRDPDLLRARLRDRVLAGYLPQRTHESADDHGADWLALHEHEFAEIYRLAYEERRTAGTVPPPVATPDRPCASSFCRRAAR